MKDYKRRLKGLEDRVGISGELEYEVLIYGHRTWKDCVKHGKPVFLGPDGGLPYIAAVHACRGGNVVDSYGSSTEEAKVILERLGYEEIKVEDLGKLNEITVEVENWSQEELTDCLLNRANRKDIVRKKLMEKRNEKLQAQA